MCPPSLKKVQGDHHRKRRSPDYQPLVVKEIVVKSMPDATPTTVEEQWMSVSCGRAIKPPRAFVASRGPTRRAGTFTPGRSSRIPGRSDAGKGVIGINDGLKIGWHIRPRGYHARFGRS
jgi:hypothetical protein